MEQIIYHTEINVLFFSKRQPLLHLEQEPWGKLYYRQKTLQCVHPVSAWTTNLHPFTIKNYAIENFVSIHYTHANGSWANSKAWALFKNSKNNICTQILNCTLLILQAYCQLVISKVKKSIFKGQCLNLRPKW